ncbi:hypothetical protein H1235_00660 [Pseudoxanthomonas sp. NC8]|nr:hypothetical protein H1235_00660 [Pseudoxanthomonas sp. NC8]
MNPSLRTDNGQGLLRAATLLLLGLAVFTGGGSQDRGWGDAITQLWALTVLGLALSQLSRAPLSRARLVLLAAAALLPAGLLVQLTGLTLTTWGTERALWAVLPALAAFAAAPAAAAPRTGHPRLDLCRPYRLQPDAGLPATGRPAGQPAQSVPGMAAGTQRPVRQSQPPGHLDRGGADPAAGPAAASRRV